MSTRTSPDGHYDIRSATMLELIRIAYGWDENRIIGGPDWLVRTRFDISAKSPAGTGQEALQAMLQSLLTDRFNLQSHRETRPIESYVLKAGRKPLLKPAKGKGTTGCIAGSGAGLAEGSIKGSRNGARNQSGGDGIVTYLCRNITMEAFAGVLPQLLGVNLGHGPVFDQTGLAGTWDFDVRWSFSRSGLPLDGSDPISVFDAVDRQMGMKLQQQPISMPVIVVDQVNETPTANSQTGTAVLKTSVPPEFETATIKPTDRSLRRMPRFEMQPGGRFIAENMTLGSLVNRALHDNNNYPIVGLPPWATGELFDIVAQAPPASGVLETDAIGPMLHALLVERFKLATHIEEQSVPTYELVALKPKMKKSDLADRAQCITLPPSPGMAGFLRVIGCQNTTMEQFAAQLKPLAGPTVDLRVVDKTGLDGKWDFTLSFSPARVFQQGASQSAGETPGREPVADPGREITIFDALEKELGLKLEKRKLPTQVIVIDHIERNPTAN